MTQFKDKSAHHAENVNMGLMDYPVLMAADILLYGADLVPIGADQKQHLEITRDIAIRFNNRYSPTFVVPEPLIPKMGARLMSLQDPTKKMSKSDENLNAFVSLTDTTDDIIRKFKRAVTDSDMLIKYDPSRAGISNLMSIYSVFTGKTFEEIEREFDGKGYGDFKLAVGEACADTLEPIQKRFNELMNDRQYLDNVMKEGAEKASYAARKTLSKVYKKVGFLPSVR
jgi:tryptophanyl-tRNA synthetase